MACQECEREALQRAIAVQDELLGRRGFRQTFDSLEDDTARELLNALTVRLTDSSCRHATPEPHPDTVRLDWIIEHKAAVLRVPRFKTRRGEIEHVYIVEWEESERTMEQTVDCGHMDARSAIDAARGAAHEAE